MPLQEDMAPMEWLCKPLDLIFTWSGGTTIDVSRYDAATGKRSWDQCIGVYDHATGKITIPPTHEAFKAKCEEWILDDMPEITAEHVADLVNGHGASNLVLYPERRELFLRNPLDPEGCVILGAETVRDMVSNTEYDEEGDVIASAAERIARLLNADRATFRNVL